MSEDLDAWYEAWKPEDERPRAAWAEQHIRKIPNSARTGGAFDGAATPWLIEPLNLLATNEVKEGVLLMPTGSGKTTLIDVHVPHALSEQPASMLLGFQTDADASDYGEERLLPILRECDRTAPLLQSLNRHAVRKDAIMLPGYSVYLRGANWSNFQKISVRDVLLDEVWLYKHGLVAEARARTHDRWNQKVVILSQGGTETFMTDLGEMETELHLAWTQTDQREWCFECPECKTVQRFSWKQLRYDRGDPDDIDETAVVNSARYHCSGSCATAFEDSITTRRALASSGRYISGNPKARERHVGWHCNALTLHYVEWGTLALEHARAMRQVKIGDDELMKIFRQKRGAENYRANAEQLQSALTLSGYSLADYRNGEPIDDEACRFLTADVQRDHFWVVVRAWRADGSSRLLHAGRAATWEDIGELNKRYKLQPFFTGIDSGWGLRADECYNICARNSWFALKGDQAADYPHHRKNLPTLKKFYSTMQRAIGSSGLSARLVLWSNENVKDILTRLRSGRMQAFEIAGDVDKHYSTQMLSEVKRDVRSKTTGQVSRRYVQINRRPNHLWDCEAMQVTMALFKGLLKPEEEPAIEVVGTEAA